MLFVLLLLIFVIQGSLQEELQRVQPSHFLYFGYGSNLLKERIHRSTNTTREGIGKLKNYRLDFDLYSKRWSGYVATIVNDNDSDGVWGALWKVNIDDLEKLDAQEGSNYTRIKINVERPDGQIVDCYTYKLVNNPAIYYPLDQLPENRQPSKAYLDVILKGAIESMLPDQYIEKLKKIKHNNYDGAVYYEQT
ncbi:hypothetical protein FQA39_LY15191 [Lamprigera yunnana]|nr:hypothetical protein FQA39_LY15191 [Lamprigera yunnana]